MRHDHDVAPSHRTSSRRAGLVGASILAMVIALLGLNAAADADSTPVETPAVTTTVGG